MNPLQARYFWIIFFVAWMSVLCRLLREEEEYAQFFKQVLLLD